MYELKTVVSFLCIFEWKVDFGVYSFRLLCFLCNFLLTVHLCRSVCRNKQKTEIKKKYLEML